MTPKEKAEQLIDLYQMINKVKLTDYSIVYHPTAKQCSLMLCNKILETDLTEEEKIYYEQVKQELNNL